MRRATTVLLIAASVCAVGAAPAEEPKGTKHALVICGIPGDDEHRTVYAKTVEKIVSALTGKYGFKSADVIVRFGDATTASDSPALKSARGLSERAGIEADVAALRQQVKPADTVWVVVLGHGHYDDRHAHLNLPGPDIDERAFGKLFEGLPAREQVFFITTAASGFFVKPLAARGRIVIAATEADREVNETIFAHALADVLDTPPDDIDRDKDGSISFFELYLAVALDVLKRYASDMNLPSEHACLDDNGDGRGSELQEGYLTPELGGPEKPRPPRPIGPMDDGALSLRTPFAAMPKSATKPKEAGK
jgi:hypothetical protein